jgi:hypothetical protein
MSGNSPLALMALAVEIFLMEAVLHEKVKMHWLLALTNSAPLSSRVVKLRFEECLQNWGDASAR